MHWKIYPCRKKETLGGEIITGKDYLRMAKSETEAAALFRRKLADAADGGMIVYVISDREQLALLPEGAVRIHVKADLETIKARFAARMGGKLPAPVAAMLERKHGMFDGERFDAVYDGALGDPAAFCDALALLREV